MDRPLCCFVDPDYSSDPRALTDVCPTCNRPYGFPLFDAPGEIDGFKVVRPLNRGFYSAVFHVTFGALASPYVLKVSSKRIYEKFAEYGKNFEQECRLHNEVAAGSDHLVPLRDMFDAEVSFGDIVLPCHVAQLDYVPGEALEDFLLSSPPPASRAIAQIALDLLQLLEELRLKQVRHNDLHDGNIIVQRLGVTSRRAEAIDDSVRAMAIDLGSTTEESRSGPSRLGDLRSVGRHIETFANRLLLHPSVYSDLDYRLAAQLQEVAALLSSDAINQRPPEFSVLRDRIRQAYDFVSSPWKEPPPLRSLDDSYNAQTLHPWFVPRLLVDPGGLWREEISVQGPLVITGMRGCGKTMLLRSLMFHARAAALQAGVDPVPEALAADHYVGLYVSCNRLLDPLGSTGELHAPDARLFVAYVRESLRAIRHLREIDHHLPSNGAAARVGEVLAAYISGISDHADSVDELVLERLTLRVLASLQRGESTYLLRTDPSAAFVALAEIVRSASSIWSASSVFFLLDDVSTRHLDEASIRLLVSRLVFSSEVCAFKMTTEEQTLEYVLKSPGLVEKARPGRDYKIFDLGMRVNERIRVPRSKGGGTSFIGEVLALRAAQYRSHPENVAPAEFLGNQTLEHIAQELARLGPSAAERKRLYHGLRALTAVCVGDIGDVLAIYETMFRRAGGERVPFPPEIQHECFQHYCAQRLYHLNHSNSQFKDVALGFAQAARDLLVSSVRSGDRLRQYSSLYVRVTTDDSDWQFEQLRKLIDAGVFVLEGGAPRTKTRDDDPILQFVLKYRKLFGLASFIGLADRDRFELSGDDLRQWLSEPKRGKDILMRNLGGPIEDSVEVEAPLDDGLGAAAPPQAVTDRVHTLFEAATVGGADAATVRDGEDSGSGSAARLAAARTPAVVELEQAQLAGEVRSVVLALGFEERTLASAERVLGMTQPESAVLVRYDEAGHADAIERLVREKVGQVEIVHYRDLGSAADALSPQGPTLVDVTGLTKPLIFQAVRRAFSRDGRVYFAHTQAELHYPLDEAIQPILDAERNSDVWALLNSLDGVWLGEEGPYSFERLLLNDADESRRRHLIASASPKHQRLLSLVQQREYDRVEIFAPPGTTARDQLARRASEIAIALAETSEVATIDSDDLVGALARTAELHQRYYVDGNFTLELGLTGSKLHAVAFAAASAAMMISQVWYIRPARFDPSRFSSGVGKTRVFAIEMPIPA